MDPMEAQLRENYAREETEYLIERSVRGGLTEIAEKVLREELARRNVTSAKVTAEEQQQANVATRQIALRGHLAPLESRLAAFLIDQLGTLFLMAVFNFVVFVYTPKPVSDQVGWISISVWFAYFFFKDGVNGQGFGKRLLRIRVVDSVEGTPCNFATSFLRGLVGMLGLIDWLFVLGKNQQRLADRVANTLVVKARRLE